MDSSISQAQKAVAKDLSNFKDQEQNDFYSFGSRHYKTWLLSKNFTLYSACSDPQITNSSELLLLKYVKLVKHWNMWWACCLSLDIHGYYTLELGAVMTSYYSYNGI